ncbi:ABC transporter [Pontibacillus halophilus JSM 076056 = DSM 19796]|uniref:ABC transporter n=1 Tax=Pontibacillus halophilus JSM 076056 = DSM 19796 TaxID=1385510 RepID=A0A0A5GBL1_9BACI|nr:ABC transporter [Pontibacillus halophilus JSM 076056 = DSM 19796]
MLDDINLELERGKITALVGHNGAGKTTLFRTLMGVQDRKDGEIKLDGVQLDGDYLAYKQRFSYIPEEPMLLSELTVYQHFQLFGKSHGLSQSTLGERVHTYVKKFEIEDKLHVYPEELSKGMRQKVQTICALLPDVALLLIDEPFMGLDLYAAKTLMEELQERVREGLTVLLTSHQMKIVEDLCDAYLLLQNGRLVQSGTMNEFKGIQRRTPHEPL